MDGPTEAPSSVSLAKVIAQLHENESNIADAEARVEVRKVVLLLAGPVIFLMAKHSWGLPRCYRPAACLPD
jgi:hypothetical protein